MDTRINWIDVPKMRKGQSGVYRIHSRVGGEGGCVYIGESDDIGRVLQEIYNGQAPTSNCILDAKPVSVYYDVSQAMKLRLTKDKEGTIDNLVRRYRPTCN